MDQATRGISESAERTSWENSQGKGLSMGGTRSNHRTSSVGLFAVLAAVAVVSSGCMAGVRPVTGLDCRIAQEFTVESFQSNHCAGVNGMKVYFQRPPNEALTTFERLLEQNRIQITRKHTNGIESGSISQPGIVTDLSYKAMVQETPSGSVLFVAGYRTNPSTGRWERIRLTQGGDQGFHMLQMLVLQAYDPGQVRFAKNVPEFAFQQ